MSKILVKLLTVIFCLTFLSANASTWTGAISSDWNTPGNWIYGGVPNSTQDAFIPGTDVKNWPVLTGDIAPFSFATEEGSKIDTKGYKITVQYLGLWGGTINNTAGGTAIRFEANGNLSRLSHYVRNCTFNGNTEITFSGDYYFYEGFESTLFPTPGGNQYNGNTKFILNGRGTFYISLKEASAFNGDLEIVRTANVGSSYLFVVGTTTVSGNLKYTNNIGGDIKLGQFGGGGLINGKVDITATPSQPVNRSFGMSNVKNLISGGKVEVQNYGFSSDHNDLKLLSFKLVKPESPVFFVYNVIEGNVGLESYTDFEFASELFANKIIGDFDFMHAGGGILYESRAEYSTSVPANEFLGDVRILKTYQYAGEIRIADGQNAPKFAKNLTLSGNATSIGLAGIKFNGDANSTLTQLTNPLVISKLFMEKTGSGKLTLSSPTSIRTSLTLSGGIIESSAASPLTFLDNAVVSGGSNTSHVKGPVHKIGNDAFTFPVGSGVKLITTSIAAPRSLADEFSVEYVSVNPTNSGYGKDLKASSLTQLYDGGYFDIQRVAGNSNVSVTLGYNFASGYVSDQTKLRVAHWTGSLWEDLGNGGTSGSLTVGTVTTGAAVTNFSPFAVASTERSNALPVTLVKFDVQKENETALLQWSTTEETNSDRFEIEHSVNATSWERISEVSAAGESKSLTSYQYIHDRPGQGLNYYRLKMLDRDGTFAYSKIESVKFQSITQTVIYPNPVAERLFIKTTAGMSASEIDLTNNLGRSVLLKSGNELAGGIDLSSISAGIYSVRITLSNGQKETHRISVTK